MVANIGDVIVPNARELCPEALLSRKVVCPEACTEGSETTNSGTDEHNSKHSIVTSGESQD